MPIPSVGLRLALTSSLHAVAYGSVIRTRGGVGVMRPSCWRHVPGPSMYHNSTGRVAPSVSGSARANLGTGANGEYELIPLDPPNSIPCDSKSSDPRNYLIKPKEPTVLSHKEYHEISSTNLLLPLAVSRHSKMTSPEATLIPGLVE